MFPSHVQSYTRIIWTVSKHDWWEIIYPKLPVNIKNNVNAKIRSTIRSSSHLFNIDNIVYRSYSIIGWMIIHKEHCMGLLMRQDDEMAILNIFKDPSTVVAWIFLDKGPLDVSSLVCHVSTLVGIYKPILMNDIVSDHHCLLANDHPWNLGKHRESAMFKTKAGAWSTLTAGKIQH